jgi:hypothetical protein
MATRKYKKIQRKTKKMKGSGNKISSSKKKDSSKKNNNSQDDLDILEKGDKSNNLLHLLEIGALSNAFKMIQESPHSINIKKTKNKPQTFKNFMNSIKDGNRRGPVSFGGSGKSKNTNNNKKNNKKYSDQEGNIKEINRTLVKALDSVNLTKTSSFDDLEKAEIMINLSKNVEELEKINELLKNLNNKKGGKKVRKTRKYKR